MQQLKLAISGAQILFVAFGAMVLVPLLTGLNPAMALLGAGIGTLLFQLVTKRKVPIFLGSSFAFIAPIIYSIAEWGLPSTMFGLFAAGFMYFVFALLIKWRGLAAVNRLLPPVVIGPVIMVIGLSVAMVASQMAMGQAGGVQVVDYSQALLLSGFTFIVTVMVAVFGSKMMRLVPILIGVAAGYTAALFMGLVDITPILNAPWFAVPHFETPQINWHAALFMLPVAIAPAIEHIGGVMILLFGTIASLGLKTVIDAKVDLMQPKNLVIVSAVLTTGVGGMVIKFGSMSFAGVGLCAILAIVLNMVLPKEAPNKILNEEV